MSEHLTADTVDFEVIETEKGKRSTAKLALVLPIIVEEEPQEEQEIAFDEEQSAEPEQIDDEMAEGAQEAEGEQPEEEEEPEPVNPYEAHQAAAEKMLRKCGFRKSDTLEGAVWTKTKHDTRNTMPHEFIKLEYIEEEAVASGWVKLNVLSPAMPELPLEGYAALQPKKDARNTIAAVFNAINVANDEVAAENAKIEQEMAEAAEQSKQDQA